MAPAARGAEADPEGRPEDPGGLLAVTAVIQQAPAVNRTTLQPAKAPGQRVIRPFDQALGTIPEAWRQTLAQEEVEVRLSGPSEAFPQIEKRGRSHALFAAPRQRG